MSPPKSSRRNEAATPVSPVAQQEPEAGVTNEDGKIIEGPFESPANDRLARAMDWLGLSVAIGMLMSAVIIAT